MCLLDHLMYDNLVYVQHHAHPSSPPLTPLPLRLMLFPTSPPSHQVLILSMLGLCRQPQLLCA